MAAQVEQVDGAQIACDRHQREAPRSFSQHDSAANIHAVQHHPDVGGSAVERASGPGGGDEVLPAAQMVCGANGVDLALVGDAGVREAQEMDADAIELSNHLAIFRFGVRHQAGSDARAGCGRA